MDKIRRIKRKEFTEEYIYSGMYLYYILDKYLYWVLFRFFVCFMIACTTLLFFTNNSYFNLLVLSISIILFLISVFSHKKIEENKKIYIKVNEDDPNINPVKIYVIITKEKFGQVGKKITVREVLMKQIRGWIE